MTFDKTKWYSLPEIAERLQVRVELLTKYIRERRLKAVKLGKSYRVSETALAEFLKSRETKTYK